MEISEIRIKNVKGFKEPERTISLENTIKSGKVNVLVAPNGWGKSSLTAAFEGLKRTILDIPKENKPSQDDTLESSLGLKIDDNVYLADSEKNEITDILSCDVIHCDTYPVVETRKIKDFTTSKGYIGVKAIQICKIPKKFNIIYSILDEKKSFGTNKKILKNLEVPLQNEEFLELFSDEIFQALERLNISKSFAKLFDTARNDINKINETEEKLKTKDFSTVLKPLSENQYYSLLKDTFGKDLDELEFFGLFYQLLSLFKNNKKRGIESQIKNVKYKKLKSELNINIKQVNTTWKDIRSTEHDGYLFVEFPNADLISNGQRDILTFTVHLQVYKSKLRSGKRYILLIDEIFDYLDDANILAAQYYLTDLLRYANENDIELILGLFTHLDPRYFRSYTFGKKVLNICYLKAVEAKSSDFMKAFIAFRQSIGPKKEKHNANLYNKLSKYCFHYNLELPNFKADLVSYRKDNLKENWCEGNSFFVYLDEELCKYLADNQKYDPYAVSLAIRIGTEKKVYERISSIGDKDTFLDKHKTKDKIEFVENLGIVIPDAYYILSLIHGETDHIEFDESQKKFNEKPVIYKLNNSVVKHMVATLFDYQDGETVPLDKIH